MNKDRIIAILDKEVPLISNLSNVSAAINLDMPDINWVGFYLVSENNLYLGPFQGEPACTIIKFDKGICGRSYRNKETIIVDDVLSDKDHIACSSRSRSEIVIPIMKDDNVVALLDIDSPVFCRFDEEDKIVLEGVCKELEKFF